MSDSALRRYRDRMTMKKGGDYAQIPRTSTSCASRTQGRRDSDDDLATHPASEVQVAGVAVEPGTWEGVGEAADHLEAQ